MTHYSKALAALLGALSTWLATALPDVSLADLPGLLAALGTAVAVLAVTNAPRHTEPYVEPDVDELPPHTWGSS